MRLARTAALTTAFALTACLGVTDAGAVDKTYGTEKARVTVKTVASGLNHPWGLAFLPDGRMLVTEKEGNLRIVSADGRLSPPLKGVPEVDDRDQGGLLDVALDPNFAQNRLVYLSFSEPGPNGTTSTAVARGTLSADGAALTGTRVIFSQKPKVQSRKHYGSRLVFDRQGQLYVTLGERSEEQFRTQAQDLDSHLGKVVRINPDGSVPADNPYANKQGALPEIWSYGHRNIQGAALHPQTGALWINEHGPRGGDEINVPQPGKNYGWPVVSYGVNYNGTPVGTGKSSAPGMEEPIYHWTPVIGASGMTFYTADAIPGWKGSLFNGGLTTREVVRLELDGTKVTHEERMFRDLGKRIRQVSQGPDGALYLLTDAGDGEILRVAPAANR
ncbi:PQQ-dependent sugar dehydrogenase [Azospirillum rugosum]|uniref:Glucose/arabinose dehydrogenase n=1 Tax=Azospirillum rugosum TaxID=416170 RepID=A0ABS4SPY3_9PROT|nr:PQQ-dependent sugar dehydrogenase [Azospirillum rugosum]MBP2294616.1 glucose/arabinose dehydrogenase [Azospirillum rugosum]MDQ0528095.1 glucose/arabinose dehydrogenase [Azospirillum rugosum]